jgi:hypothetical protein
MYILRKNYSIKEMGGWVIQKNKKGTIESLDKHVTYALELIRGKWEAKWELPRKNINFALHSNHSGMSTNPNK